MVNQSYDPVNRRHDIISLSASLGIKFKITLLQGTLLLSKKKNSLIVYHSVIGLGPVLKGMAVMHPNNWE